MPIRRFARLLPVCCLFLLPLAGCGGTVEEEETPDRNEQAGAPAKPAEEYQTLDLNLGGSTTEKTEKKTYTTEDVRRALNPLQVMVGGWTGLLRKAAANDAVEWAWDFSDRKQPALAFSSMKGLALQSGRLTYLPAEELFLMEAVDPEGRTRKLTGTFTEEPHKVAGDDNRAHITYKLEITEAEAPEGAKPWRMVFNQQDNNQILLTFEEKIGSNFRQDDILRMQREGTSFAKSFDDYGDRTCIVSQGLGTKTVTHAGKTYYVCCSGCEAAFNDDPEYWIAKAEERKKSE